MVGSARENANQTGWGMVKRRFPWPACFSFLPWGLPGGWARHVGQALPPVLPLPPPLFQGRETCQRFAWEGVRQPCLFVCQCESWEGEREVRWGKACRCKKQAVRSEPPLLREEKTGEGVLLGNNGKCLPSPSHCLCMFWREGRGGRRGLPTGKGQQGPKKSRSGWMGLVAEAKREGKARRQEVEREESMKKERSPYTSACISGTMSLQNTSCHACLVGMMSLDPMLLRENIIFS